MSNTSSSTTSFSGKSSNLTYLSLKESLEITRFLHISDQHIIARRCHQLMPQRLSTQKQKRAAELKIIGERYCGHSIELWLWEKGYKLNGLGNNSFTIEPQYIQGNYRIDFRVEIKTQNNIISIVIDAKNWARYTTKQILKYLPQHVKKFNSFNANYKLMYLNKRLIPKAKNTLYSNNIEPIEVDEHLTDKLYIRYYPVVERSMRNSINNLDNIIKIPNVLKNISTMTTKDVIKYDIELGKPYKFIKYKWDIKRSYYDSLRNEIVKSGKKLPSRKSIGFKRLAQYNSYI